MAVQIKPGAFLRRGTAGLSPEALATLIKHPDKLQALYDGLDARRDAALEAIAASEATLAATEAREAALATERAEQEATLAAALSDLEPRERAVARGKKALTDFLDSMSANPLSPIEES